MRASLPKSLGWTGAAVALAAGGWVAYSAFAVDHRRQLGPALDGERRRLHSVVGGIIAWYADDSAAGRPLGLIHSVNAAASAYEMRPLWQRAAGRRPVHAIDLPGFGFSERGDRPYRPELYAQAIVDWVEESMGPGADIVASSLSCEFAALAALWRPDLFRSLAFLSPTGLEAGPTQPPRLPRPPGRVLEQAFYDLIASRAAIRYFLAKSFVGPVDDGMVDYAFDTAHQRDARFAPLAFLAGTLFTPAIRQDAYLRLERPVHVIHDEDPYVDFAALPEVLARPDWSAERIAPTRGLPHWDEPDRTWAALERFWART